VLLKSIIGKNAAETSVIEGPSQQDHVKKIYIYRILEKFQLTAVRSCRMTLQQKLMCSRTQYPIIL
jgi:hypothetical protein